MAKYLILIYSLLCCVVHSFGQNYSKAFDEIGYVTCDKLELEIIERAKFTKGWDDFELNSSFLRSIKFYWFEESNYWFSLVSFKGNDRTYVYCGLRPADEVAMFQVLIKQEGMSSGALFNELISPNKCDCK